MALQPRSSSLYSSAVNVLTIVKASSDELFLYTLYLTASSTPTKLKRKVMLEPLTDFSEAFSDEGAFKISVTVKPLK